MVKIALLPLLLGLGCLLAGAYGALHNQISYTVAPEYFHAYKFEQFSIPAELRDRRGAALVGWLASWWMGLIVGVPVLLVALFIRGEKEYVKKSLTAFVVVVLTALAVGLAALGYASCTETAAFNRAGTMHNFSYLGGFLGILTASGYLAVARSRQQARGSGLLDVP